MVQRNLLSIGLFKDHGPTMFSCSKLRITAHCCPFVLKWKNFVASLKSAHSQCKIIRFFFLFFVFSSSFFFFFFTPFHRGTWNKDPEHENCLRSKLRTYILCLKLFFRLKALDKFSRSWGFLNLCSFVASWKEKSGARAEEDQDQLRGSFLA